MKAAAGVLTVTHSQDSGLVYNDGYLSGKKDVRFRGWTEIVERDASTARGLVECELSQDEHS